MLLEGLLLILIVWYIVFHLKRRRLYALAAMYEGPPTLPFIGNALKCVVPVTEIVDTILKNVRYYNSPIRFWFGPYLVLYVTNPNDIKVILNSPHCLTKLPYMYRLGESFIGRGLPMIPVEEWKVHRRLISPNFNQKNLESYFDSVNQHSVQLVCNIKEVESKGTFDILSYLANCTLRFVLEALLGLSSNDVKSEVIQDMLELSDSILRSIVWRMSNVLYLSELIYTRSSSGKQFLQPTKKFAAIMDSIAETWKNEKLKQYSERNGSEAFSGSPKPKSFDEYLLLADEDMGKLTAEELREEVQTIIVAGFDTTAIAMGYILMMLGMHPEVQEKVFQEIISILGTEKQLRYVDLDKFEYLEQVIKETLRIFPIASVLGRYSDCELQLSENRIIPAKTNIMIGILSLHRDPDIWPNPTEFNPDRFLPEEERKRHPYSWIPFSAGPRNCIGYKLGFMAMKVMSINVLKNYKVKTDYKSVKDIHLTMLLMLKPTDGFKISICDRRYYMAD